MNVAIGIDLGGTSIKGALVNDQGECLYEVTCPTEAEQKGEVILSHIDQLCQELIAQSPSASIQIIGLGTPGIVDPKQGGVISGAHNLPGWVGTPFLFHLQDTFNCPAIAHNDVTIMTYGEFQAGAAQGATNAVCITLGTGIGGGFIFNQTIYEGSTGYAGEVGHMIIEPNGRLCTCGSYGCWEAYASATALVKQAHNQGWPENSDCSAKIIFEHAANGNSLAQELVASYIEHLSTGVANLINICNPDVFVIGGGVSHAGQQLFEPLLATVQPKTMAFAFKSCHIRPATLGNKAGVIGAALFALHSLP